MTRVHVPSEIETSVLILSRRRCALCFGLNADAETKTGQIAHVNRNARDNRQENLVFLCLEHHDQYDTRRSQSKGFTEAELRQYRTMLYRQFNDEASPIAVMRGFFLEFKDLVPEKWGHIFEEALEFYTGSHRTQSVVLITLDEARSIVSIAEQVPPNDVVWIKTIVDGAVLKGWLHPTATLPETFEATVRAKVVVEALGEIPQAVKDAAVRKVWFPA